jgi:hypothetical protein
MLGVGDWLRQAPKDRSRRPIEPLQPPFSIPH